MKWPLSSWITSAVILTSSGLLIVPCRMRAWWLMSSSWQDLGDKPLGMPWRGYVDQMSRGKRPTINVDSIIVWAGVLEGIERRQRWATELFIVWFWLWTQCDQVLSAPAAVTSSPQWTVSPQALAELDASSLKLFSFRYFVTAMKLLVDSSEPHLRSQPSLPAPSPTAHGLNTKCNVDRIETPVMASAWITCSPASNPSSNASISNMANILVHQVGLGWNSFFGLTHPFWVKQVFSVHCPRKTHATHGKWQEKELSPFLSLTQFVLPPEDSHGKSKQLGRFSSSVWV